jgi:hypothetical protein
MVDREILGALAVYATANNILLLDVLSNRPRPIHVARLELFESFHYESVVLVVSCRTCDKLRILPIEEVANGLHSSRWQGFPPSKASAFEGKMASVQK